MFLRKNIYIFFKRCIIFFYIDTISYFHDRNRQVK